MKVYTIEILVSGPEPTEVEVARFVRAQCMGIDEYLGPEGADWRITTLVAGPSREED